MTDQADKEKVIDENYRAGKSNRLKPGVLDEHYIRAFLDNPFQSQQDALKEAMQSAGVQGNATRQRAYEIHTRLREQIDVELIKLARDAKAMGLSTLMKLCKSAESESVKASVATTLTKELFPNVTLRKEQTIEDMETELEQLRNTRQASTGKELH